MRTRFTWIAAILALLTVGFLVACSTKYTAANNGLVVLPTAGSAVMQTFSLNLGNGHLSQINNAAGPPIPGAPGPVILDPAGAYAYVIVTQTSALTASSTGIAAFQVASDGKLSPVGVIQVASPVALAMDSAGKFLFVASGSAGTVSVFSVGSNASLTAVGTTTLPNQSTAQTPTASALAVTPTVYPFQYSYCSGFTAPTTENLYVTDSANYVVLNYAVSSSGGLTLVQPAVNATGAATGTVPSGIAVDPCNRFVYVSNGIPNNSVSAYTMCTAISATCQFADFSLHPVTGSPFTISGDGPGPLAVDAFGDFLYVVDTGSSQLSGFRISASTGALTSIGTYAAGVGANSIAIRSDDSWLFVANSTASTVSQYGITPSSGILSPQPATTTFNIPTGVAVK